MEAQVTLAASKRGYSSLHEEQMKAITSFASGNDVFVLLPTGFGNTLCYSVLPVLFDLLRGHSVPTSILVVVSPLVALMQDQVSSVEKQGLSVVYMSELTSTEIRHKILRGGYQIAFLTPERLIKSNKTRLMFVSDVYCNNLVAVVVDEAHCIQKRYVHTDIINSFFNTYSHVSLSIYI